MTIALAGRNIEEVVERVASALLSGDVVVLPTDTVYGLAALPTDADATARLFELKGRQAQTPIAVLCADVEQAAALAGPGAAATLAALADRWWPGPLTVVAPRRAGVGFHLGGPATTIGLRVPHHDLVRAVATRVGPIAATSANRHGEPTPETAPEVATALGPGVPLIVDAGVLAASASTVVDVTSRPWRVLREGPISAGEILELADALPPGDR
ncbi:MAG: L-threonylcarbamoyladenylate synthase [Actinomycetota bacterium]